MNALDWVLLALLILAGIRGYKRGLVKELGTLAAPVAGLATAIFVYKWGAAVLVERFHLQFAPEVIAFLILFLLGFGVVRLLAAFIHQALDNAKLETLDMVLGLVIGLVEGTVIAAIILIILQVQPFVDVKGLLSGSVFGKALLPIVGPEVAKALDSLGKTASGVQVQVKPVIKAPVKP